MMPTIITIASAALISDSWNGYLDRLYTVTVDVVVCTLVCSVDTAGRIDLFPGGCWS